MRKRLIFCMYENRRKRGMKEMKSTSDVANLLYERNQKDFKSKAAAQRAAQTVLDIISESVAAGEDVRLHGFGSFAVKQRAARKGVNLQTGEKIEVPAKKVVRFKAASALAKDVQ